MTNKIKALEAYSSNDQSKILFILFHGYGADAYDLQSLAQVIQTGHSTHWLFPQGIFEVPIGPGWTGRAWWPITLSSFEGDVTYLRPKELDSLTKDLLQFVEQKGYRWDQIYLGGFSQGAMLATELFLSAPQTPKGLVILSGALISKTEWSHKLPQHKSINVFMSHGQQDPVLPSSHMDRLESLFKSFGAQIKKVSFSGQHEIPPVVIEKLNQWLRER